jgi:hypothetical protein
MKLKLILTTAIAGVALALPSVSVAATPPSQSAQFTFLSQSAIYNPLTGEVTFKVLFNQEPDFFTADSLGRQANSFQFFIVGDPSLPYPYLYDSLIYGEGIHLTPDLIPILNGNGTFRGEVPYTLNGPELTFSAPFSLISNRPDPSDVPYYQFQTYEYGALTGSVLIAHILVLTGKDQCHNGGWAQFGFKNQGQCIAFVNHGP